MPSVENRAPRPSSLEVVQIMPEVDKPYAIVCCQNGLRYVVRPDALVAAKLHTSPPLHLHSIRDFEVKLGSQRGFRLGDEVIAVHGGDHPMEMGAFGRITAEMSASVEVTIFDFENVELESKTRVLNFNRLSGWEESDKRDRQQISPMTTGFRLQWQTVNAQLAIQHHVFKESNLEKLRQIVDILGIQLSIPELENP